MNTTHLVLQRLTSGIYRAALERFYFDSASRAQGVELPRQILDCVEVDVVNVDVVEQDLPRT
jgi:hypothetical protein